MHSRRYLKLKASLEPPSEFLNMFYKIVSLSSLIWAIQQFNFYSTAMSLFFQFPKLIGADIECWGTSKNL